jgi:uncharacterized protein (DUF1501 family)
MKRRQFLQNVLPAGISLPSLIAGFSFNAFGENSPFVQQVLAPYAETDHVLVIIQLNGGNDGLNTVIPLQYFSNYANARPNIFIPEDKVLTLTGNHSIGLHPALQPLQQLYADGKLRIVNSVGYPQPSFSHFRATDIWMSASDSNNFVNSGWAGRYLNNQYPNFPAGYPNSSMTDPLAIQIGSTTSLTLQGPAVSMGMSISNPTNFYNLISGVQDASPNSPAGKELSYIRTVAQQTQQYAEVIKNAALKVPVQGTYPTSNTLADQLKIVARLIKGGLKTRVYMVNFGGFDTHAAQVNTTDKTTGTHATLLARVAQAIAAFQKDIEQLQVADRVVGMTFSEFGRRIKSNGSTGTDHGTSAPLFVFGKNVMGGISGNAPAINTTVAVSDNLPFQYDFRSVYATLLSNWLCVDDTDLQTIMLKNYQVLPLVNTIGCKKAQNLSGDVLVSNYPNPFSTKTVITFKTTGGHTLVQVLDTMGKVVSTLIDGTYTAGTYTVVFDATQLPSGVYYARLQNMVNQQVRAMLKIN